MTTLDSDTTKPSVTAPGDGPADTADPFEMASSHPFSPGPEAFARGTVNTVVPVGRRTPPRTEWLPEDRIETETRTRPDGTEVTTERNLELGTTRVLA